MEVDQEPRFEISRGDAPRASTRADLVQEHAGGRHRLNTLLAIVLLSVVVLAVVPFASNRPAFWTIWGAVLGLIGLAYALALLFLRRQPMFALRQIKPEALLFAATMAYLVVQMLPLGRWFPLGITLQDGTEVATPSISLDPGSTSLTILQFVTFGVLFYLTGQVAVNRGRARGLLLALLLVIAGFALYGILALTQLGDPLLFFEKRSYLGFATGTFVNRNSFATFLASGLAVGGALLLKILLDRESVTLLTGRIVWVSVVVVSMLAIGATLLATGSRMGTASAAAGLLVVGIVAAFGMRGSWRLGVGLLVATALVAVAIMSVYGTQLVERLIFTDGLDEGRAEIYRQVWAAIMQRPWLGYGGGSFDAAFPIFQEPGPIGAFVWDHAHSTYLSLWFESGLVFGSLPLLIILSLSLRALVSLWRRESSVTSLAMIGVVTVFAVHSLLDFSAEIEANALMFTFVLAIGTAGTVRRGSRSGAGA